MKELTSQISNDFMRRLLWHAILFGAIGIFFLVGVVLFFPKKIFEAYGWVFFLLGFACIIYGMVPYQKAKWIRIYPNRLKCEEGQLFCFFSRKKYPFRMSCKQIQKIEFYERTWIYGIEIFFYQFHKKRRVFFPYFSRKSYEEFKKHVSYIFTHVPHA